MPNTSSSETVATYIKNLISTPTNMTNLGLAAVWYGDQDLLPTTPAACVAPGNKTREFQGASLRILNMIDTYVLVYYSKIQDIQQNLHAAVTLSEGIEAIVHADQTLGGNVISVLCMQNEPGIVPKGGDLIIGCRLTFQSMSKTMLPN